jgi:hypothetical protein
MCKRTHCFGGVELLNRDEITEVTRWGMGAAYTLLVMSHLEQFEILQLQGDKWQLVAAFQDLDLANEVARNRRSNVRLVRATYEDGKRVSEEILLDLGSTRETA